MGRATLHSDRAVLLMIGLLGCCSCGAGTSPACGGVGSWPASLKCYVVGVPVDMPWNVARQRYEVQIDVTVGEDSFAVFTDASTCSDPDAPTYYGGSGSIGFVVAPVCTGGNTNCFVTRVYRVCASNAARNELVIIDFSDISSGAGYLPQFTSSTISTNPIYSSSLWSVDIQIKLA